jgi:hypothetical protein
MSEVGSETWFAGLLAILTRVHPSNWESRGRPLQGRFTALSFWGPPIGPVYIVTAITPFWATLCPCGTIARSALFGGSRFESVFLTKRP